jgi:oxygen-independent coproporphyrinogen-3 oxidase
MSPDPTGIYIHIPFCATKCAYCDFLSFAVNSDNCDGATAHMEAYVDALLREMEKYTSPGKIDTVYFGGGTPTALPPHLLCKILTAVGRFPLTADVEITIEANPGTLTPEYLQALKNGRCVSQAMYQQFTPATCQLCVPTPPVGAHSVRPHLLPLASSPNRLSLGLQTTQPHLLTAINRTHTMGDFLQNYHAARQAGFTNINIDLMFALPGQTLDDWADTLDTIIALAPQHISAYSLTPAENTPLWDALDSGQICLPSEETDRAMYHLAIKRLTEAGYTHYELSNFAKPGFESRHNVNCWRRVPYRAFGLGAHSFDGARRWHNAQDMAAYLAGDVAPQDVEVLTPADVDAETMILGLRLLQGVPEKDVPARYENTVAAQIKKGLLTHENGCVRLTSLGLDLANQVFEAFL